MKLDEQDEILRKYEMREENNWQRLIYSLRRYLDDWSHNSIKSPWGQMKLSYFPVIFNISVDGSTAAEITRRSMVIKQTVSRTIKELEEKGIIISKTDKKDKRSERLYLTPQGKKWVIEARMQLDTLQSTYTKLVGEKDLAVAANVLRTLIKYHEDQIDQGMQE